jgi:hypothetical protein
MATSGYFKLATDTILARHVKIEILTVDPTTWNTDPQKWVISYCCGNKEIHFDLIAASGGHFAYINTER